MSDQIVDMAREGIDIAIRTVATLPDTVVARHGEKRSEATNPMRRLMRGAVYTGFSPSDSPARTSRCDTTLHRVEHNLRQRQPTGTSPGPERALGRGSQA